VTRVAGSFASSANAINAMAGKIAGLSFAAGDAGRDYTESGAAIEGGLDKIVGVLRKWAAASKAFEQTLSEVATRTRRSG
jgi:hypothetical protein